MTERAIGEGDVIHYATGSLLVKYLKPVPVDATVEIRGEIREAGEKKTWVDCTLEAGGSACATCEVLAVRVPASWAEPG